MSLRGSRYLGIGLAVGIASVVVATIAGAVGVVSPEAPPRPMRTAARPLVTQDPVLVPPPGPPRSREEQPQLPPQPIIKRVEDADMQIAITFDACATKTHGYGFDRSVYRVLQREKIPATIFVSGRWVEFHPEAMTVLADNPLIEFANHSYDHPHMSRLSSSEMETEIDRTELALGRHGLHSVAFRPPFGDFSERVLAVARDKHLPAVLWDVVSGDPSPAITAAEMIHTVVRRARSGSIVIFHINGRGAQTAQALPPILRKLREHGFRFVNVSTLLNLADVDQGGHITRLRVKGEAMNKDQFKEKMDHLKDKLKERVASITGNREKEAELAQRAKGASQEKVGGFEEEIESEAKDSGRH